jgi:hypothetical protein
MPTREVASIGGIKLCPRFEQMGMLRAAVARVSRKRDAAQQVRDREFNLARDWVWLRKTRGHNSYSSDAHGRERARAEVTK